MALYSNGLNGFITSEEKNKNKNINVNPLSFYTYGDYRVDEFNDRITVQKGQGRIIEISLEINGIEGHVMNFVNVAEYRKLYNSICEIFGENGEIIKICK
jgi:hypothetical protein